MVTLPGFMEFEHSGSKMVQLSDQAAVMVAGSTLDGMRLVHEAVGDNLPEDIAGIANDLARRYAATRAWRAEQMVLSTHGLTIESFHAMHRSLNEQVVMLLENGLQQYDLGVELLLAGADESGAHIHTSRNPGGGNLNHDPIGWAAIGIGAPHVVASMAGPAHSADAAYEQTLFRVYSAKRRAEVAPGVGGETEMAVIDADGLKRLNDADLEQLALIYNNFRSITDGELQKQLDTLNLQGDENGAGGND
jgi:20S proteasome alpha/beta subunit